MYFRRRHFYKGSCSQAPETPNCPLAAGESSTHLKKDSLRWKTAQEGTEASLPPQFSDSFITILAAFSVHKASVAHPDCSCWAWHPQHLPQAQGEHTAEDTQKSTAGEEQMGLYCILDHNAILGYTRYGQGIGLKEVMS